MEIIEAPRRRGRPKKITPHIARKIFFCYAKGFTDQEVADLFGMSRDTITELKKQAEYSGTIKQFKEEADLRVINALYHRAVGYSHPEDKIFQYEGEPIIVPTVKHYPPDTEACKAWLFCRRPNEWRPPKPVEPIAQLDENDIKRAGTLIQIFRPIREVDQKRIEAGEPPMKVLFSDSFRTKMEAKKNGHINGNAEGTIPSV